MDKQKFDALTRAFAMGTSRRTAIKGIFGGAVGVAVASTHLSRAGAQGTPCTPTTVLEDCVLPDACTAAQCLQGVGTEAFFCSYSGGCAEGSCEVCDTLSGTCIETCGGCEVCVSGLCVNDCNSCEECINDQCVYTCDACETCNEGVCTFSCDGVCCGGTCIEGGQCCVDEDCVDSTADFCSSVSCIQNICTSIPECPEGQQCCGIGAEGAYCAECCNTSDCGDCETCETGECVKFAEYCPETGECYSPMAGGCCDDSDCGDGYCSDGMCTECPAGLEYCPETKTCYSKMTGGCCEDDDCGDGYCIDNECQACRYDSDCPECFICGQTGTCVGIRCPKGEVCCGGYECAPEDECCSGVGDYCGVLEVTSAGGDSPQFDCCDGLVCCHHGNSTTCAECCNDGDCAKGAYCHSGWCEYPDYCDHDNDCPHGTCCCKDGSCSGKCCDHHPHHPHYPKPTPPASGGTVSSLPVTGAGPNDERNNLLGAAALGAAAAVLAARKLRETPGEATSQE